MGGNAVALRFLLDKGVSPDLRTLSGETPMHYATQLGRLDIINMLLARGGDPNVRADSGKTPLDLAREFKIPDIIDKMENPQKVVLQASQEGFVDFFFSLIPLFSFLSFSFLFLPFPSFPPSFSFLLLSLFFSSLFSRSRLTTTKENVSEQIRDF